MSIKAGQTVTRENGGKGLVVEIRQTPNGQSAKVRFEDRKIASWMWTKDLTATAAAE